MIRSMENNNITNEKKRSGIMGKIAIIILIILIVLKGCSVLLSKIPSVPNDYTEKVKTGGEMELNI